MFCSRKKRKACAEEAEIERKHPKHNLGQRAVKALSPHRLRVALTRTFTGALFD